MENAFSRILVLFFTITIFVMCVACEKTAVDSADNASSRPDTKVESSPHDDISSYMPQLHKHNDIGYVEHYFWEKEVKELLSNGPDDFIDNLQEPYTGDSNFYTNHPEQATQLRNLCKNVEYVPFFEYKNGDTTQQSLNFELSAFKTNDITVQPYFYSYADDQKQDSYPYDYIITYYSDDFWQWLKAVEIGGDRFEKTYHLKDGLSIDCLLISDSSLDMFYGTYIWFKYNDALFAIVLEKEFEAYQLPIPESSVYGMVDNNCELILLNTYFKKIV